eukprot:GILJ01001724.1.p1 GENE.GILJ01001724.1~~GILJ01001724.1.p1  ORF type:complete len:316 (-),score=37.62 GILJ01001724.1:457-1404(-)
MSETTSWIVIPPSRDGNVSHQVNRNPTSEDDDMPQDRTNSWNESSDVDMSASPPPDHTLQAMSDDLQDCALRCSIEDLPDTAQLRASLSFIQQHRSVPDFGRRFFPTRLQEENGAYSDSELDFPLRIKRQISSSAHNFDLSFQSPAHGLATRQAAADSLKEAGGMMQYERPVETAFQMTFSTIETVQSLCGSPAGNSTSNSVYEEELTAAHPAPGPVSGLRAASKVNLASTEVRRVAVTCKDASTQTDLFDLVRRVKKKKLSNGKHEKRTRRWSSYVLVVSNVMAVVMTVVLMSMLAKKRAHRGPRSRAALWGAL